MANVKSERVYSWPTFWRDIAVGFPSVTPFELSNWPYAYSDDGLYPAAAARPIPIRPWINLTKGMETKP